MRVLLSNVFCHYVRLVTRYLHDALGNLCSCTIDTNTYGQLACLAGFSMLLPASNFFAPNVTLFVDVQLD